MPVEGKEIVVTEEEPGKFNDAELRDALDEAVAAALASTEDGNAKAKVRIKGAKRHC
jgi:hypothetical protein